MEETCKSFSPDSSWAGAATKFPDCQGKVLRGDVHVKKVLLFSQFSLLVGWGETWQLDVSWSCSGNNSEGLSSLRNLHTHTHTLASQCSLVPLLEIIKLTAGEPTSLIPLAAERGHQHQHYDYLHDHVRFPGCSSISGYFSSYNHKSYALLPSLSIWSTPLLPKVWSSGQQHPHHLGAG